MKKSNIILEQLGGSKFAVMTGTKNFKFDTESLTMKLIPNRTKAKYLRIELNVFDTYDMTFFSLDKNLNEIVKIHDTNVYNDMLQSSFTSATGLYTSLF